MRESAVKLAGVDACIIGELATAELTVVFLHGYAMRAADLSPFARSLRLAGTAFVFPEGPLGASPGRAWWAIDEAARARALATGPRDLAAEQPPGRIAARRLLGALVRELRAGGAVRRLLVAGFSQGGMLACDALLAAEIDVEALALLSSSRIALEDWQRARARLAGQRVLVTHGRDDRDLAFAAGERLTDFLRDAGAAVTAVPFDGGHEIPLLVWRQFRAFAASLLTATARQHDNKVNYGTP